VSQRRACEVLNQSRSSQRYQPVVSDDEAPLVKRMLELVREFPRFGYRQIGRLLRNEGFVVNNKRIYRLWRREGLKVPQKKLKKRRLGDVTGGITRRQAEHKDHVWSVDFIFDRTANGRPLKILSVIDEYTRECLALEVSRKLTSEQLIEVLTELFGIRGVPEYIRSDNGPEFVARRLRSFLENLEIGTSYIEPGSPWQNGYVESFHSRFRDECLALEEFATVREAIEVIGRWRQSYNHRRPHSSLGGLTPAEFSSRCVACVSEQSSARPQPAPALQQHPAEPVTQPLPS
jgi:transposase InsO family protein